MEGAATSTCRFCRHGGHLMPNPVFAKLQYLARKKMVVSIVWIPFVAIKTKYWNYPSKISPEVIWKSHEILLTNKHASKHAVPQVFWLNHLWFSWSNHTKPWFLCLKIAHPVRFPKYSSVHCWLYHIFHMSSVQNQSVPLMDYDNPNKKWVV